jgi:ferredoxin
VAAAAAAAASPSAETKRQKATLCGRCLHLGIMPCYLVCRVRSSGASIHF